MKRAKFDPDSKTTALDVLTDKQELAKREESKEEDVKESKELLEAKQVKQVKVKKSKKAKKTDKMQLGDSDEEEISVVFDDQGNEIGGDDQERQETIRLMNDANGLAKTKKAKTKPKNAKPEEDDNEINKPDSYVNQKEKVDSLPERTKKDVLPDRLAANVQELRAKLAKRINELREKRKAPGTAVAGAPLSREAILAARREKLAKKQLKRKREEAEKPEEDDRDEIYDDMDKTLFSDPSVLFGQVEFKDGAKTSGTLTELDTSKTKKRPRDLVGQLKHIQVRKAKLASLDENKQREIQDKALWSKAILHSRGEKVKDDERLLKKSIKLQGKQKKKSEREWQERKEYVEKGIQARQAKREENLAMRRLIKGKNKKERKKILDAKKNSKKRAGFEGKGKKRSKIKRN